MCLNGLCRREYKVYGRVQGVGFRYTARQLAHKYDVTGWVKNEYDGSVTLVLQSNSNTDFECFLRDLNDGWIRIEHMESRELVPIENERTFTVRY